jgi:hypothetical protein
LKKRLLLLVAGCAGLWVVLASACLGFIFWTASPELGPSLEDIERNLLQSGVAAGLCLLPTAATLLWCDLVLGSSPEKQLAAVFGGTGIRMAFVLAVSMVLYFNVQDFNRTGFWLWVVVFYLATLTLEMILVLRRQALIDAGSHTKTPVERAKQGAQAQR